MAESQTCREEICKATPYILSRSGDGTFSPAEMIQELESRGTAFRPATIRTHIVSRMCVNAPDHHAVVYRDLERVARGRYRPVID